MLIVVTRAVILFAFGALIITTCMVSMQEAEQVMQAVRHSCEAAGLQPVPALVDKCLQLQATLAVRFGVMLVGPSGEHSGGMQTAACYPHLVTPGMGEQL